MTDPIDSAPASAVAGDAAADKAPNPRRHYDSPEDLHDDITLSLTEREDLLREWKQDLDQRLEAEAEGMSASDPISADKESRLAGEARRVATALERVVADRARAEG